MENISEVPCPCGKGKIKHFFEIDDWNRCKEFVVIDCGDCRKNYVITSKTVYNSNPVKNVTEYFCKNAEKEIKINF